MDMKFTHYTKKKTVNDILRNGLAWIPNRRGLIADLLPSHNFEDREPQQFGMISFTDLPPETAHGVRNTFGNYGIIFSQEWTSSNNLQKVIYVDNKGSIFEALHYLFEYAYKDLEARSLKREGEVSQMAYTNKARAAIAGGDMYAKLLELYQYMEPIEHSYQQEYRMVHPHPCYGYKKTKQENIDHVSPPKGWAIYFNVIKLTPNDVVEFVCPENEIENFRKTLDQRYRTKRIDTFPKAS